MDDREATRGMGILFEDLAATQHEIWASWEKYLHSCCLKVSVGRQQVLVGGEGGVTRTLENGDLVIPRALVERWERQITTRYADLTPAEQVSDREQVLKFWDTLRDFIAGWLEGSVKMIDDYPVLLYTLASGWKGAMDGIDWAVCPSCGLTVRKSSIEAGHRPDCAFVPVLLEVHASADPLRGAKLPKERDDHE